MHKTSMGLIVELEITSDISDIAKSGLRECQ